MPSTRTVADKGKPMSTKTAESDLQKEYQTYFHAKMKEHGIDGLGDLDEDKLKKFFNSVSSGWEKGKGPKKTSSSGSPELADRLAAIASSIRNLAKG